MKQLVASESIRALAWNGFGVHADLVLGANSACTTMFKKSRGVFEIEHIL